MDMNIIFVNKYLILFTILLLWKTFYLFIIIIITKKMIYDFVMIFFETKIIIIIIFILYWKRFRLIFHPVRTLLAISFKPQKVYQHWNDTSPKELSGRSKFFINFGFEWNILEPLNFFETCNYSNNINPNF